MLLVVDDDPAIRRILELRLSQEGFTVETAENGRQALDIFEAVSPDLVVLDVMMPLLDGYSTCEQIRLSSDVPIIMLTALGDPEERVRGLNLGADDYLLKPFSPKELIARIRSVLRRCSLNGSNQDGAELDTPAIQKVICFGKFKLDLDRKKLFLDGELVRLTALEYALLRLLISKSGTPISRETILKSVWGYDDPSMLGDQRVVDVHISRLRRKLNDDPKNPALIQTAVNQGYLFAGPLSHQTAAESHQ